MGLTPLVLHSLLCGCVPLAPSPRASDSGLQGRAMATSLPVQGVRRRTAPPRPPQEASFVAWGFPNCWEVRGQQPQGGGRAPAPGGSAREVCVEEVLVQDTFTPLQWAAGGCLAEGVGRGLGAGRA